MDFPPFWSKGTEGSFSAWGWSHQSLADASTRAFASAKRIAAHFKNSQAPLDRYYGGHRPMREEVLREFKDSEGKLAAAITRNSYGCQVLNTASLMFVDVDLPEDILHESFLKKMFRGSKPSALECAQTAALTKADQWASSQAGWGWRFYRTFAGFRLIATHRLFQPEDPVCEGVFAAMEADPLYRKLCQTQKCFRARLTPKPWRCGIHDKPTRWPWANDKELKYFQTWSRDYEGKSAKFATCQFIRSIGDDRVHEAIKPLLQVHDEMTGVASGKPLA
jgi:hypothetical protein